MSASDKANLVRELARATGFDACGIAPVGPIDRADYLQHWLSTGRAGTMGYMHRYTDARVNAARLLPNCRSIIVCALNYHQDPAPDGESNGQQPDESRGRIAMYAWGRDYHKVVRAKARRMVANMRDRIDEPFDAKICVDTSPIVEREYAMQAGIGWIGKNTMVLNQRLGSYFVLGEIITTLDLAYDEPAVDHCGSCRKCLDACPTGAFPDAYQMDASRCISYLTIEHRGKRIPAEFHDKMGNWVFGCDICQEVCPFNRGVPMTQEPDFAIRLPSPYVPLNDLLSWSDEQYDKVLTGSAIRRAKPYMLRRNAGVIQACDHNRLA